MKNSNKTREQLLNDTTLLNAKIARLEKDKEIFQVIAENTSDNIAITSFDLKAEYLYVSPSVKHVLDYDPKDLVGKSFFDFIHPDDRRVLFPLLKKYVNHKIKKLLSGNNIPVSETVDFRFKKKNGDWCFMQSAINIVGDQLLSVARDITGRKQVEEEFVQIRERLELAMDIGEHGFWDWNLDTDDIYFSPRWYTMLGYKPGELPMSLDTWVILMHPDDRKTIVPEVENYVKIAKPYEVEFRLKTKDGDWKWISGKGKSYEKDNDGIPHRAVGVHVDITERKQAEEALKLSNENFQQVVSNITTIIWKADIGKNGAFENTYISPVVDELLELPAGTIKNDWDKFFNYIKPEYLEQVNNAFRKAIISPGKKIDCEYEVLKDNGQTAWFQSIGRCFEKNGKLNVFGSTINITERKQAEGKLRKLSKVVETTSEAVVITDMQGNIEYVNQGLLILGGFEDDRLIIGKSVFMFSNKAGEKQLKEIIIPTLLSEGKWNGEVSVKRKNGSLFPAEMICSLILDEEGNPKYLLSQYYDITKRKKAEEELQGKMNELKAFYRTTLGREGRVIELKQEVNELLEQLGKRKKYKAE